LMLRGRLRFRRGEGWGGQYRASDPRRSRLLSSSGRRRTRSRGRRGFPREGRARGGWIGRRTISPPMAGSWTSSLAIDGSDALGSTVRRQVLVVGTPISDFKLPSPSAMSGQSSMRAVPERWAPRRQPWGTARRCRRRRTDARGCACCARAASPARVNPRSRGASRRARSPPATSRARTSYRSTTWSARCGWRRRAREGRRGRGARVRRSGVAGLQETRPGARRRPPGVG